LSPVRKGEDAFMMHMFKRKEEKFVLPRSLAEEIRLKAGIDLQYSDFNRDGELTDIRTTYLENDDFLLYHLKKSKMDKRFKIRIREYGRNGQFEKMVWIELKEKVDGQGYKSRFKIDRKYVWDFVRGADVFPYVLLENSGVSREYLITLYDRIQSLIIEKDLYPRLVMQYSRLALQGGGNRGIRLTFDSHLRGGILQRGDSLFELPGKTVAFDENQSIVELKIDSLSSEKALVLKETFSLKSQSFSKYIFGLESFFSDFNQNPESLDKRYIPISELAVYDMEYAI
jgi:hypothetical protein